MGLLSMVPASTKGWLRFKRGHHADFYPFGFAMNGQTARLEAVRQIIWKCGIKQIVETGTFRGTTTEWFAQFGVPVISIESHRPTHEFAHRRLAKYKNVLALRGDSTAVLPEILLNARPPTLLYLDAHWDSVLPLKRELGLICATLAEAIIIIDDFEVPGDDGYTFDRYGDDALTTSFLQTTAARDLYRFFPATPSVQETGARRGWIVLTQSPATADVLARIVLLAKA